MALPSKEQIAEIVKKIQADPALLKEFQEEPVKTIEKVGEFNIPDFLDAKVNQIIKEQIAANGDKNPMDIISKFIK
ncbi:MAG: hypothetical protein IJ930_11315 [Lachnospiraceae bacterium]|nr:hypothetical protein [Lachnospiraceae bacterium]